MITHYVRESFIFSVKVSEVSLGYKPKEDVYAEFYKNPTLTELNNLEADPEEKWKICRGFIDNSGNLFAWYYDLLHIFGIDYLTMNKYIPYHDGDLHRIPTRFGIAVNIHKYDVYLGDSVKIKGFEHIIREYFDKAKEKNKELSFIMKRKGE